MKSIPPYCTPLQLVVSATHIHVAEIYDGVAHIAWTGKLAGRSNGDEPYIATAAAAIAAIPRGVCDRGVYDMDWPLGDCTCDEYIRPRLCAAGVPLA